MATSANRPKMFPARSRKSYRLEMESRTLYLLLSLMALTGVVVFYLGVETGRALRDPNAPVSLSAEIRTPGQATLAEAGSTPKAFNNVLKSDKNLIEGLRDGKTQATLRTENLLKKTNLLKLEEVPVEAATRPEAKPAKAVLPPAKPLLARNNAPSRPKSPPAPTKPKLAARKAPLHPTVSDGSLYTVQVFSSRLQKNAQELADKLKNKGFPAYISRFQSSQNEVLYRVRVGKATKARAMELSDRLKREALMRKPQLTKL